MHPDTGCHVEEHPGFGEHGRGRPVLANLPSFTAIFTVGATAPLDTRSSKDREEAIVEKAHKVTLSVPEVAQLLGVSRNVAYRAVREGQIPALRIGRRVVIPLASLDSLLSGADIQTRTMHSSSREG